MLQEMLVLGSFFAISCCAHWAASIEERKQKSLQTFTRNHAHAITVLAALFTHPVVWHSVREYLVHFIIYSGHVLSLH